MLTIIKVFIILFLLCLWEQGTPWQFSKQISKLSFQLSSVHVKLGQTEEDRKTFFGGCKKGGRIARSPPRAFGCHKRWKSLSFCEIWNNPTPLCCLLDPLTNKRCRAWSSMINFWIDSRTCQKYRILLSARQRSNNYLEPTKENVLGEYDALTLTMHYLKVLHDMISNLKQKSIPLQILHHFSLSWYITPL